ncbi:flavin carrier protein 2 [Favolaschia claudopus]|uniref:Flavin carrier protein 2 n=1 Tax=Favolaschia claudopus TaxID=2862362 RepID=A0AAW0E143_9AGAR
MLSSRCRGAFKRVSVLRPRYAASKATQFPFSFPTNIPNPTPHQIFHLPRNASQSDVKTRYIELVRKYHPDKVDSSVPSHIAHARFQAITAAYNALRTNPSASSGHDRTETPTPAARAMYKRRRNLYSGPQLADDTWKDRIIVAGVIFVFSLLLLLNSDDSWATQTAFCFIAQAAMTRHALLQDAMIPWNSTLHSRKGRSPPSVDSDPRLAEHVPD